MEGVHEDVRAGVDLGDAWVGAGDVPRSQPAGPDDLSRQPGAIELVRQLDQLADRLLRLPHPQVAIRLEHAMALVAEHPAQAEARDAIHVLAEVRRGIDS